MIKYRTFGSSSISLRPTIYSVDCIKETNSYIRVKGEACNELKISKWYSYHDTWKEAHEYILNLAKEDLYEKKMLFERAEITLKDIKEMEEK